MMKNALQNVMRSFEFGEELIAAGADELFRRWQASATVIGKLCAEPERWKAALGRIQAPVNLADILRRRTAP
ncbi:MAG TPA: hypothetical protein VN692_07560 [Steroidobacteraceae bacterium]|nr:hypothetical protein [Steroidobacteraceae bacterium]